MKAPPSADSTRRQRWGTASALADDDEARRRLTAAAATCIARRGTAKVPIEEIAAEAGVSRMTVYRYFGGRDEIILAVLLSQMDAGLEGVVRSLRAPRNASRSLPDLILKSLGLVPGSPLNEAVFSADSRSLVAGLEHTSDAILDALHRHVGPLLERWQADGQLYPDLDLRETTRWINAVSMTLLAPPWLELPSREKRTFIDRYLVRALVPR